MKQYHTYSESSYKGDFPKFYKKFKYSNKNRGNIHITYYGFCHTKDMIGIIGERINSKNWVKERVSNTCGDVGEALCDKYPNCIIVVEERSKEVIELIKIKPLSV